MENEILNPVTKIPETEGWYLFKEDDGVKPEGEKVLLDWSTEEDRAGDVYLEVVWSNDVDLMHYPVHDLCGSWEISSAE